MIQFGRCFLSNFLPPLPEADRDDKMYNNHFAVAHSQTRRVLQTFSANLFYEKISQFNASYGVKNK